MMKMKDLNEAGIELLCCTGLASEMLSVGAMQPLREGQHQLAQPGGTKIHRRWGLCGGMPQPMCSIAQSGEMHHSCSHLQRDSGLTLQFFALSVGGWQHRFVLPLLGEEVREFLADACSSPVHLSWVDANGQLTLSCEVPAPLASAMPDASCVRNVPKDAAPLVDEVTRVATQALLPWQLPALGHQTPLTCVSVIYPPSLLAAMG